MIWLDKSGHAFHPDDTKEIEQLLIGELKHLDSPANKPLQWSLEA